MVSDSERSDDIKPEASHPLHTSAAAARRRERMRALERERICMVRLGVA
jgi:hypothetical protein